MARPLLELNGVGVRFGGVHALAGISFAVGEREIGGVIGPNGAGKTTLFNALSRVCDVSCGAIRFAEQDLLKLPPHEVAAAGIARTFQNVALFDRQTVRWNVRAGRFNRLSGLNAGALLNTRSWRNADKEANAAIDELLRHTRLHSVADRLVSELPFGTRKRVELARALAMKPRLLLLDEPAAGLNHDEVNELQDWIRGVRDTFGVSVLLIEHHMNLVMRMSDHVVVLDFGRKIADGLPAQVAADPAVQSAYLGAPA